MRTDDPRTWERVVSRDGREALQTAEITSVDGKARREKCQEGSRTWLAGAYNLFSAITAGKASVRVPYPGALPWSALVLS